MNKEFCTYEQALALKELGFDGPCLGWYTSDGALIKDYVTNKWNEFTVAPLKQQVFRWFRDKHDLTSWVYISNVNRYFYTIMKSGRYIVEHKVYPTYEEAEQACLNKLIELI